MIEQLVQVFGSLLVLAAFVAAQRGALTTTSRPYLVLNLVGSAILAVLAAYAHQWGFLLLEGVWALVSGRALAQRQRRAGAPAAAPWGGGVLTVARPGALTCEPDEVARAGGRRDEPLLVVVATGAARRDAPRRRPARWRIVPSG